MDKIIINQELTSNPPAQTGPASAEAFSAGAPAGPVPSPDSNSEANLAAVLAAYERGDYLEARRAAADLARRGFAGGYSLLGYLCLAGEGGAVDVPLGLASLEQAVAMKWPVAFGNLGNEYTTGTHVPADYAKAKALLEEGTRLGDGLSMNNLGWLYENGWGVPQDPAKAFDLYQRAIAADRSPLALEAIGCLYRDGRGTGKDLGRAIHWFAQAAQAGNGDAIADLAALANQEDSSQAVLFFKVNAGQPDFAVNLTASRGIGYRWEVLERDEVVFAPPIRVPLPRPSRPGGVGGPETVRWQFKASLFPEPSQVRLIRMGLLPPGDKAPVKERLIVVLLAASKGNSE